MGPVARISFYYCSTKVFIKTVETVKAAVFPVFTSNYCTEFIQSFVARTRLTRFVAETEKWTTVERYSLVEHGCCYYRGVQYQPSQRKHRDPNLVSPTLEARYISMIGELAVSLNVHIRFSLTHIPALTQRLSSLPSSLSLSLSLLSPLHFFSSQPHLMSIVTSFSPLSVSSFPSIVDPFAVVSDAKNYHASVIKNQTWNRYGTFLAGNSTNQ